MFMHYEVYKMQCIKCNQKMCRNGNEICVETREFMNILFELCDIMSPLLISQNNTESHHATTVKFLNFGTLEKFGVIYLKFIQRGKTLRYFVKMVQME